MASSIARENASGIYGRGQAYNSQPMEIEHSPWEDALLHPVYVCRVSARMDILNCLLYILYTNDLSTRK